MNGHNMFLFGVLSGKEFEEGVSKVVQLNVDKVVDVLLYAYHHNVENTLLHESYELISAWSLRYGVKW